MFIVTCRASTHSETLPAYNVIMHNKKKGTELVEEAAKMRRKLQEIQRHEDNAIHEQKEAFRMQHELEKLRKLEFDRQEKERKTKKFFYFDEFERKKPVEDHTYFYGDIETPSTIKNHAKRNSWRPHGHGEYHDKNMKILEGEFEHGDFQHGSAYFPRTNQQWLGHIRNNTISGAGTIKVLGSKPMDKEESNDDDSHHYRRYLKGEIAKAPPPAPLPDIIDKAIAVHGRVICRRSELQIGTQLEFSHQLYGDYGSIDGSIKPRVIILKHETEWKYWIRYSNPDTWPRDRLIDLSVIGDFKVLRHLPLVYHLHLAGEDSTPDQPRVTTDYRYHLSHRTARALLPSLPKRPHVMRRENMFESREVGIGAAREEDEAKDRAAMQQLQWKHLIAERKAKFQAERQAQVEAEQAAQLEQSVAGVKRDKEEAKRREEEALKAALDEELSKLSESCRGSIDSGDNGSLT